MLHISQTLGSATSNLVVNHLRTQTGGFLARTISGSDRNTGVKVADDIYLTVSGFRRKEFLGGNAGLPVLRRVEGYTQAEYDAVQVGVAAAGARIAMNQPLAIESFVHGATQFGVIC